MPHDIFATPLSFPANAPFGSDKPHGDNFTVPLAMVTFAVMLVAVGVFAQRAVRRRHFELFYYSHHVFLAFFVTSILHATGSWPFVAGGLAMWICDGALRLGAAARLEARLARG